MATRGKKLKLKDRDPEKYERVAAALKQGKPIRMVAVQEDLSHSTVQMVRFDITKDLPQFKRELAGKYTNALSGLVDKLIEETKTAKGVKDISIAVGIVHDKLSLLAGEATQITRVEHIELPSTEDILASLPTAKVLQVVDVPAETPAKADGDTGSANLCPGSEPDDKRGGGDVERDASERTMD